MAADASRIVSGRSCARRGARPRWPRRRRSSSPAAAAADGGSSAPGAPVILISVDTLRADHLPAYGYRGVETPNLDALRQDAVLFENAYSHVPLTLPSHTSIFTGLLPPQNGVRDNLGYALGPGPATLAGDAQGERATRPAAPSRRSCSRTRRGSRAGFDFYEDNIEPTKVSQSISRVQRGGDDTQALLAEWVGGALGQARSSRSCTSSSRTRRTSRRSPTCPATSCRTTARSRGPTRSSGDFLAVPQGARRLRPRADRLPLGPRRGPDDHGEDEHGVLHLPRGDPRAADGQASEVGARAGETVRVAGGAGGRLPDRRRGRSGSRRPPGLAGRSLARRAPDPRRRRARRIYSETLYPRLHLGWSDLASLDGRARPLHRVAAPGALRHRGGPGREERPRGRPAAGLPLDAGAARPRCRGRSSRRATPTPSR